MVKIKVYKFTLKTVIRGNWSYISWKRVSNYRCMMPAGIWCKFWIYILPISVSSNIKVSVLNGSLERYSNEDWIGINGSTSSTWYKDEWREIHPRQDLSLPWARRWISSRLLNHLDAWSVRYWQVAQPHHSSLVFQFHDIDMITWWEPPWTAA